jgi:hypothetical protein
MPVTFPTSPLTITVELALGADLTADPSSWAWTDITTYARYNPGIAIVRGGQDERTGAPSGCTLVLDNTDGRFTSRKATGAYYPNIRRNTPLRVRVDPGTGAVTRFIGYVDEWPLQRLAADAEKHVTVTASGLFRRLAQRDPPTRSPLFSAISGDPTTVMYWPLEDGSGATEAAEYLGRAPMRPFGEVSFGADDTLGGSDTLPSLAENAGFQGIVAPYAATSAWTVRWVMKVDAVPASNTALMYIHTPTSAVVEWRLVLTSGGLLALQGMNNVGTDVIADAGVTFEPSLGIGSAYGRWWVFSVSVEPFGADAVWLYAWEDETQNNSSAGTEAGVTVGNVTRVDHHPGTGLGDHPIGHIAVFDDDWLNVGYYEQIIDGTAGELAVDRIDRVCVEAGVRCNVDTTATSKAMGRQPLESLLAVLEETVTTDQGLLIEALDGRLQYLDRTGDRYGAAVALALAYSDLVPEFVPVDDDQAILNDVTVKRRDGSSARVFDQDHIDREGRYEGTVDVNPETDAVLRYHGEWRVGLGTVDDYRYPEVNVNFGRTPTHITAWLACDIDSRVTISSPPSDLPPDLIELRIVGYTETITPQSWQAAINCQSGLPWLVYEVEGTGNTGRLDAVGCEVLAARTAGATSVLVSMTSDTLERGSPLWSTSAVPYDLGIAGERVTATAVASGAATFVGAGTAAHANNASVAPSLHASTTADDLVLVLAAIRNTAAAVTTPAGYTQLWPADNASSHVKLLGKVAASGEAAPTITFTGGAAGDDTSAQTATFRRAQCAVHNSASSTNASAQDITTPALATARNNCVIVQFGWKQDDWTSVTGPGTEIGEPDTTTGNDQGLVWAYTIQTTAAYVAASSFVVTGGAAAVSKGVAVAIPADVQTLTVTRAVNTVSKAIAADAAVSLWRPNVVAL